MPEAFCSAGFYWAVGCLPRAFSGSSSGQRLLCVLDVRLRMASWLWLGSAFGVVAFVCFLVFLLVFRSCLLFLRCCGVGPFCSFRLDALALVVGGSAVVGVFLFRVLRESDMVLPRSTNNRMAAGFVSTACTSSSSSSSASVAVMAGTSSSLSDQIASAVATALGNSLPAIMAAIQDNSAPVSSAPPAVTSVSSSSAMVVAGSQAAPSGTLRLPSFVSTFLPGPAISGSDSACLVDSFPSPVMSARASGSSGGGLSFVPPLMSPEKAFVVGPGHAPIPAKVVSKIISGQFVDLADLLSANLRAVDQEPHTFLDGKLLVSQKCRLVEISDILTWTEAFTIYQMVLCAAHPH